jgi:hypothetical protein
MPTARTQGGLCVRNLDMLPILCDGPISQMSVSEALLPKTLTIDLSCHGGLCVRKLAMFDDNLSRYASMAGAASRALEILTHLSLVPALGDSLKSRGRHILDSSSSTAGCLVAFSRRLHSIRAPLSLY